MKFEIKFTVERVKTVIFKWNPSISSYSMDDFIDDLCELKEGFSSRLQLVGLRTQKD